MNKGIAAFVVILVVANTAFFLLGSAPLQEDPSAPSDNNGSNGSSGDTNNTSSDTLSWQLDYTTIYNDSSAAILTWANVPDDFLRGTLEFTLMAPMSSLYVYIQRHDNEEYDPLGQGSYQAGHSYTFTFGDTYVIDGTSVTIYFYGSGSWPAKLHFSYLGIKYTHRDYWDYVSWLPLATLGLVALIIGGLVAWKSIRR